MDPSKAGASPQRRSVRPTVAWLLFVIGCAPYLWSVFIGFVELGDPPYTGNDRLQRLLLASWLLLFASAVATAKATREPSTFESITSLCSGMTILGLFFVL
jgi:hypothetical protein